MLDIWHHVASQHNDLTAADNILLGIRTAADRYAIHPELGQLRSDLAPNVRCFVVKSIVVFYVPVNEGIEVLQVIHGARDVSQRFRGAP